MAFGQKVEAKDILGMETEEFHSKLGKVDSIETRIAAMEEAANKSTSTILAQLEALKPKPAPKEEVDPDVHFLASPNEAISERLNPLAKQTTDNTIMLMHRNARESYPKDFERWGGEIVTKMGELSAEQQSNPQVWRACVMMVRGEHAGDLEKGGAEGKFAYMEAASAEQFRPQHKDGLSAGEREMVRTLKPFGMTPEKYNNGKERLVKSRAARLGRFAEVG